MSQVLAELDYVELDAPIKLAFFDIDGTLLDKNGHYSQELVRQIARVRECGVRTAIASGRPPFAARFLMDELGVRDAGVFCTGAFIYSPGDGQRYLPAPLRRTDTLALVQRLRQLPLHYELYTGDHFYFESAFASEILQVHARHLRCDPQQADLLQVANSEPVFKFIVGVDANAQPAALEQLESEFAQLHFAYASLPEYPHWRFANVIDRGACKRRAFQWLLEHHGVAAENVISFGDSHSDKAFIELAGVGVAMGNATDEVKRVARFITKNAWDDGVAYALSRLIK